MDPTATLAEIRERLKHDDVARILELFTSLDEWISKGGFLPEQWQGDTHAGRPRRTEDGPIVEGVNHGTRRGYNLDCRCLPCTTANRLRRNLTPEEITELKESIHV
jgi:hypothetical protein